MLEIGSVLDGKYKILNVVGRGGMSVVYLAMNEKANKQWAVKEVRKDGVKDFEVVKQSLVAETDMLKRLDHPNLPSIVDVIEDNERFLIVMDYVQGNSLNTALEEYGAQPQDLVIDWAKQLCDVLGYLHTRKPAIIYRDMKPANIMLKPDGKVTLIDFGTAREFKDRNIADTTCLGTIGYAAPEQFGGMGQTDGRTDIYCLGTTLYHLVTGMSPCEPPYEIRPIRDINPSLSPGLEKIILKCTRPDPNDRYQSAAELMYDLEHYEEIDDIYIKKQKRKVGAFAGVLAAAIISAGVSVFGYVAAEGKKSDNYEHKLNEAEVNSDISAYREAILIDPTRTEAYLELLDFIEDDKITDDELGYLDELTLGISSSDETIYPLSSLEKSSKSDYQDVCYQFGNSIISYYDKDDDKIRIDKAVTWFEKAADNEVAQLYCDAVDCRDEVDKNLSDSDFGDASDAVKKLWDKIIELNDKIDSTQDADFKAKYVAYSLIVDLIDDYPTELVKDGQISQEDIISLLDSIKDEKIPAVEETTSKTDLFESLATKIITTEDRITNASNIKSDDETSTQSTEAASEDGAVQKEAEEVSP